MKDFFIRTVGSLAMAGAMFSAVPAQAQRADHGYNSGHRHNSGGQYRGGYSGNRDRGYGGRSGRYRGDDGDDAAILLGAGVIGLALGSSIAADRAYDYDDGFYEPSGGYDAPPYGYPGY